MSQPIDKIKKLTSSLPKKDQGYAEKFINSRDFESLMELIDSDIYLVRMNQTKETPKEEYNVDLEMILELKAAVEDYMSYLVLPEDFNNLEPGDYEY